MKKALVTGGTVFVSRYIAEYFVSRNWDVFVLNRNTRKQSAGVHLIRADKHCLGNTLKEYSFDLVIDNAYTGRDVKLLLDALGSYGDYSLISSSAVYPEDTASPFQENSPLGRNKFWGKYGIDKIEAEEMLRKRNADAYILRPPYLYGPMNNVYREAFVFDCVQEGRKFCLPKDGNLRLQFFHVEDFCRFIESVLRNKPSQHTFNVGNRENVSVLNWVRLCYQIAGKEPECVAVGQDVRQRDYFCFYDYEYSLDVSRQYEILENTKPLRQGLQESFEWYIRHHGEVVKKPYFDFIDRYLA